MFHLIEVVLNGFVSASLKIDQPETHHVEFCFSAFFMCLLKMLDKGFSNKISFYYRNLTVLNYKFKSLCMRKAAKRSFR